jgi:acetyl-CoA carboxylase carboxyltransferase component
MWTMSSILRRPGPGSQNFANPYKAAIRGYVDDVIDPAQTRARLCSALTMLLGKRQTLPSRKHGNMPV